MSHVLETNNWVTPTDKGSSSLVLFRKRKMWLYVQQDIIKIRERSLHIGLVPKVIPLKVHLTPKYFLA